LEKAPAIDSVMFVVVRNVVRHNFFFRLTNWLFVLHLFLPIWFAFIPKNLGGLGAGVAIFAKTPRLRVGLERGV
jgi:hypothetical protein